MRERNIEVQIGTYALHTQPVFKDTKRIGNLSNSLSLFNNLLALPLHSELSKNDQGRIIYELIKLLQE